MGASHSSLGLEDFSVDKSKNQVHEDWTLSSGKLNGTSVSVFSAVHPQSSRKRPYIEKALQCSKIYRHPGILKYLEGGVFGNEIFVVTESATPLLEYGLEVMSSLEITIGLSSIMEALVFLHDKAGVSHNNICPTSIFVTSEGNWKLWGFEYLCTFGELTRDHIERINQYCYEKAIPPDDKTRISPAYQHARDCYAFGKFIQDYIAPLMASDTPHFAELMSLMKEKALSEDWTLRPRLSTLSEDPFFRHEFLKLHSDITNVLLLPSEQKDTFIKSLPTSLRSYPEELVASTLGPLLFSHQILLIPSSSAHLMPSILTPKEKNAIGIFSSIVFRDHLMPHILKLFSIHDATIRKILLANFEQFAYLIPEDTLKNALLPELLLGIRDMDETLIVSTLKSLAHLVPILGANVVIGSNREQIFTTAKPKVGSSLSNDLKKIKKRKEKFTLPIQTSPTGSDNNTNNQSINKSFDVPEIPERSSPDGGEMNEEVFKKKVKRTDKAENPQTCEENDSWSEWEEMIDKPPTDIVGRLEVTTPEVENTDTEEVFAFPGEKQSQSESISQKSDNRRGSYFSSSSRSSQNDEAKSSIMKLTSKPKGKDVSEKLGEEYSIKSIKVKKKPDTDLDLFADLAPNLNTKAFDLETMLMEASNKVTQRNKIPSVSDTLAELELQETSEGDGWQDEPLSFDHSNIEPPLKEYVNPPSVAECEDSSNKIINEIAQKLTVESQDTWEDWE